MYSLITNDVEEVSIVNNNLNYKTANKVSKEGLPKLLDIYTKYGVKGTFYFTGTFAKNYPHSIELVAASGHEVGCHGYSHLPIHGFDVMTIGQQYAHLSKAKRIIENIVGPIEAFRAPALRIGYQTPQILEELGFKTDSSISSQRFDGPMSFGSIKKLNWIFSPRGPYLMDITNPYKRGNSSILEVPVSALFLAYMGTTLRVSPHLNRILGGFLFNECQTFHRPLVFLFHPTEIINDTLSSKYSRRNRYYINYIFKDVIRRRLKLKNLGNNAINLLEELLKEHVEKGVNFVTMKDFRNQWLK